VIRASSYAERVRTVRDWALTIPFLVAFGLCLAVFDVAGRVVRPFSLRAFEAVMAALQRSLMATFRICGTRVVVERSSGVAAHTGYVIISNHQSMFDIALIGGILFTNYPKYVAKRELGRWIPAISLNLRRGGNALIDRGDRHQAVAAIDEMAREAQRRGVSVVIFPEGRRSRDGEPGRFHRLGTVGLLRAADRLPVIPVTVDGSWRLLRHNLLPVPFGTTVRIHFGEPLPRSPDDAKQIAAAAEERIRKQLAAWQEAADVAARRAGPA
jgi:1-acyl-sn-glycerol-3-phosphate acyltransferase